MLCKKEKNLKPNFAKSEPSTMCRISLFSIREKLQSVIFRVALKILIRFFLHLVDKQSTELFRSGIFNIIKKVGFFPWFFEKNIGFSKKISVSRTEISGKK